MRKTTIGFLVGAGCGIDPFAPKRRITRMHPRRDEDGHSGEGEGGKTGDKTGDKDKSKTGETPEQKALREAQEKITSTEALSQWLVAEAQFNAEQARQATLTDEQRAAEQQFQSTVDAAVAEARLEIAGEFAAQIDGLQTQLVDALIEGTLSARGLKVEQFRSVLDKLDKSSFIGEDGAVNKDEVTKLASELAGAATARPPRTGGPRGDAHDRGFGKYLPEKN